MLGEVPAMVDTKLRGLIGDKDNYTILLYSFRPGKVVTVQIMPCRKPGRFQTAQIFPVLPGPDLLPEAGE